MTEDLLDYWVRLIKPFFPTNAWIVTRYSGDDHIIEIDWKLDDDPGQPNRRSRKIQITISDGAVEDYLDKNKKEHQFLKRALEADPRALHHSAPDEQVHRGSSASRQLLIARTRSTWMTKGAARKPPSFPLTIRLFSFLIKPPDAPFRGSVPQCSGTIADFQTFLSRTIYPRPGQSEKRTVSQPAFHHQPDAQHRVLIHRQCVPP